MSALPKITVVTPSFNQGAYIERTIESVLSQGYHNLEYIIVDGGSTDNSVEVIRKFERHLSYWVSEKDRGQSHALNKGFRRATGSILTWLNSDDWYATDALATFEENFRSHPEAGVVAGRGQLLAEDGTVLYESTPAPGINFVSLCGWLKGGHFQQPSVAFSRQAWAQCGEIDETINFAMDLDLWLRIAKAGFEIVSTDRLLSFALSHPGAKTTASVDGMLLDCARVISAHGSSGGYEDLVSKMMAREQMLKLKLRWYEKNYGIVVSHPLLQILQPLIKRFSSEGRYWQNRIPPWSD